MLVILILILLLFALPVAEQDQDYEQEGNGDRSQLTEAHHRNFSWFRPRPFLLGCAPDDPPRHRQTPGSADRPS